MTPAESSPVARWATRIVSALLLSLVVLAIAVLVIIPRATHGTALTVLTGSMTPRIPVGSVVVDRPVDPGTLQVGDIATYQVAPGRPDYITHRIVKIDTSKSPAQFIFKGDANRGPDMRPVPASAIRGKVWFHVPYLGGIRDAISTAGAGLLLVMLALIGYALAQLTSWLRERRSTAPAASNKAATDSVEAARALSLQLLVATFSFREFEGLQPDQVAALLGADLLDRGADQFTIAIAREQHQLDQFDQFDELTQHLLALKPIALQRSEPASVPACGVAVDSALTDTAPTTEGCDVTS